MGWMSTFLLRLALSIFLAFGIGHVFFPQTTPGRVLALAAVLFGFAYVFEYTRKRDKGGKDGT